MPQFTIPEETFSRLAERAAALNLTVEQLVLPVLDQVAPRTPSADERKRAFEELTRFIRSRADRYPPGHVLDDSRESIYEGRGE